uniref:NADH dehydrogenase n=1 Tax=Peronospora matthiolae TaxID=2874970 RepID=A0AAV1UN60_9STRA
MFVSRVLRMAATKTSTGLVGLNVNPNARRDLIQIYRRTLEEVKILPPEAKNYRNAVEQITNFRLNVVEKNEDENVIERTINCGQLEELIEQAEDELSVIPVYIEHKLWESPVEAAK